MSQSEDIILSCRVTALAFVSLNVCSDHTLKDPLGPLHLKPNTKLHRLEAKQKCCGQ